MINTQDVFGVALDSVRRAEQNTPASKQPVTSAEALTPRLPLIMPKLPSDNTGLPPLKRLRECACFPSAVTAKQEKLTRKRASSITSKQRTRERRKHLEQLMQENISGWEPKMLDIGVLKILARIKPTYRPGLSITCKNTRMHKLS